MSAGYIAGGGSVGWRAHQAIKRLEEKDRDKQTIEEARDIIYGPGAIVTVYGLLLEIRRLRRSVAWYKSRRTPSLPVQGTDQ